MAEVLGRVVATDLAAPRGPDAVHRIRVPRARLKQGAVVEFELPRHLVCALCEGGGCDTCDRSGAVTLRERGAPADVISVALPQAPSEDAFVIRLPERGGLAAPESGLPRGYLLLRVEPSAEADASVSFPSRHPKFEAARRALSDRAASPAFRQRMLVVATAASVILLAIWLLWRR
jgi:hypothetical protein